MIRASAPGRCGIIGNPTDGYGGCVVSSSLRERAVAEIVLADEIRLEICGHAQIVRGPEDLALDSGLADVAKAVLTFLDAPATEQGFHLRAETTIPVSSGLAGSTAMLVAILGAVLRFLGVSLSPYEVAETARHIEFGPLNCVCGFQDQYMASFGGLHYLDFRGKEPSAAGDPVFATVENLEPFVGSLPLVLANTGVQRHSGRVHHSFRQRWCAGEAAVVEGYRRIEQLARLGKKAMLAEDWSTLGQLMNENHAIQRDLGGSGEANERLIQAALDAGAFGAKLAGAGKGGTIIAAHENPQELSERLLAAGAARVIPVIPSEGLVVEGQI